MDSISSHPALIQVAGAGDREAHAGRQRLDDRNGETSLEGAGRHGERPAADDDGLRVVVADGLLAGGGEPCLETVESAITSCASPQVRHTPRQRSP